LYIGLAISIGRYLLSISYQLSEYWQNSILVHHYQEYITSIHNLYPSTGVYLQI